MKFFLLLKQGGEIRFSPFSEADKPEEREMVLKPALPFSTLIEVCRQLPSERRTMEGILKVLRRMPFLLSIKFSWEETLDSFRTIEDSLELALSHRIRGRQLTESDLKHLAQEMNTSEEKVWRYAENQVRQGLGEWRTAITKDGGSWSCQRCGENEVEEWPSIYGQAATCRSCSSLGRITSLEVVYRDYRTLNDFTLGNQYSFNPHWLLTPAQVRASQEVLQFVTNTRINKGMVWAACGAGKTEVCFPAIDWALRKEIPVLFAAPRMDVVHDVAPRLIRDFKGLEVQVLSSGVPHKFSPGSLVLATTHQILRFYHAFGLIFLDEMDAFPYAGNEILAFGLKQALAPGGKILYLTATPSKDYLKEIELGNIQLIRLPARHHRRPIPVPEWVKIDVTQNMMKGPEDFLKRLESLAHSGPVLIFVPKISWVRPWVELIRRCLPYFSCDGSYSSDPERARKINELRQGKFNFFIATTILERGVTISGAQVVVLAADHPVFDERVLIQMAGRAGRSASIPEGQVLFLAAQETRSIKTARRQIEEQNNLAVSLGLIDV